jgi:hypothetical protein
LIHRSIMLLALLACAGSAYAQGPVQFFPRYDFHLGAERLSQSDPRFVWDTNFGADMDVVDYGRGRATLAANYEAVLGKEFRSFDPNQGNYILDSSLSGRVHGYEFAALLHHTSRHLGDRFKRVPVAWNMLGVVSVHDIRRGRVTVRPRAEMLGVLQKSNVDYNWEANAGADVRFNFRRYASMIYGANARFVGVAAASSRGTQKGGRLEGGLRFEGERGAIELVVAAERRIDAYPLDVGSLSWVSAGFRFVSR